jgi:AraC-like DNA-binding protein
MASMPEQEFSLIELAEMANLSQWHFLRQFKSMLDSHHMHG